MLPSPAAVEGGVEVSFQLANLTQKQMQRHCHRAAGQPFNAQRFSNLGLAAKPDALFFGRPEQPLALSQ
jgi:hypothetical protein